MHTSVLIEKMASESVAMSWSEVTVGVSGSVMRPRSSSTLQMAISGHGPLSFWDHSVGYEVYRRVHCVCKFQIMLSHIPAAQLQCAGR
jgi:hypothetical protein